MTISRPSSLTRCRDLTAVSRLIGRQRRYAFSMKRLRQTQTHEQHLLLSAPATLAMAIDHAGLTWPEDRPLRVLMLGSHYIDLLDRGQWFRFTPALLHKGRAIDITAVDFDPAAGKRSTVPDALLSDQRIAVRTDRRPARTVLQQGGPSFDIAIRFSVPDHGEALLDDLIELAERGIPLYFASFSATHALLNHAILRAHRANAEVVVARSPFATVSKRIGEQRNQVLSRVAPERLPFPGDTIDADYFDALPVTAMMVDRAHRHGNPAQDWEVGAPVDNNLVHTLDGIAVDQQTFELVDLSSDTALGKLQATWHEHVAAFDPTVDEVDRLIWAAHVMYFGIADGLVSAADKSAA